MGKSRSRRSTTSVALCVLVLFLGACASRGPVPRPGPAPGPTAGQPPNLPGTGGFRGRFPRYTEAIKQISLRAGHLGWGGLEAGMTFRQAELVVGKRLPPLGSSSPDVLCGDYTVEVEVLRQPLRLEFDGRGGESRLKAIWLALANPSGELSVLEIARALKARFPDLEYVPSPYAPDLAESVNPKPLYRLGKSGMIFIDPRQGVYFGEICVD
jgi:hypothetical protein